MMRRKALSAVDKFIEMNNAILKSKGVHEIVIL